MGKSSQKETQAGKEFEADLPVHPIRKIKIDELQLDDRNANKGTEKGKEIISNSIELYGIGRGVLADKNLKLIAGNHAVKEMKERGIENVIVVPTDGKTLVVTQRTDIDKDSKEGHGLAIADNRASEANLNFDVDVIRELDAEFDLDLDLLGIDLGGGPFFPPVDDEDDEEERDASEVMETDAGTSASNSVNLFPVAIMITKAEKLAFDNWKKKNSCKDDTEGFRLLFNTAQ